MRRCGLESPSYKREVFFDLLAHAASEKKARASKSRRRAFISAKLRGSFGKCESDLSVEKFGRPCQPVAVPSVTSPLLLDRVPFWAILASTLGVVLTFASIYWGLDHYALGHGLIGPAGEPPLAWYDYIYFSLVTQATVGYGDIRPIGWSRFVTSIHAVVGICITGFLVAKITTAAISRYRILKREACDYWGDIVRHRDGRIEVGLLVMQWRDGALQLSGRNFNTQGILVDSFRAVLMEDDWPQVLTFRYTSDEAAADYVEGYISMFFHASASAMPHAFSVTVRDQMKPDTKPVIRGWRVLPEESVHAHRLNEHPDGVPAVEYFIKNYLPRLPEVPK